jgi:rRNA-processing protein FCF1
VIIKGQQKINVEVSWIKLNNTMPFAISHCVIENLRKIISSYACFSLNAFYVYG